MYIFVREMLTVTVMYHKRITRRLSKIVRNVVNDGKLFIEVYLTPAS